MLFIALFKNRFIYRKVAFVAYEHEHACEFFQQNEIFTSIAKDIVHVNTSCLCLNLR